MKLNSYVNIPLPTLKRYPVYFGLLKECRDKGDEWISASYIAGRLNLKSIQALLADRRLTRHGFQIVAAFDVDKDLVAHDVVGLRIHPMEILEELTKRLGIKIAILTVPEKEAQPIADLLVKAGILGIWNFSSLFLDVDCSVTVINEDLGSRLALLAGRVTHGKGCEDGPPATELSSLSFNK
jgi:NADH/NAD ratio-sensing transcriptional regulator Rex